jgi:thiol-disulfide isomerase/thioredoxin
MKPHLKQFLDDFPIDCQYVDIQEDPDTAKVYGIMAVPTIIILDDKGEVTKVSTGFNDYDGLYDLIKGD